MPFTVEAADQSAIAIGIDVGGTKIAGAVVDLSDGKILRKTTIPVGYERGGEAVLQDVMDIASELLADARSGQLVPLGLGVGIPELVNSEGQVFSKNLFDWEKIDVEAALRPILPNTLNSDVRSAALAEARYGAGRGLRHFYFVSIGTGISGVLVHDGVAYCGSRGAALVIANSVMRTECPVCNYVHQRAIEDVASGPGIARSFKDGSTGEDVVVAARHGEPAALAVIDRATRELGNTLAVLIGALDPEAIIVGGGLGVAPGEYFERLQKATQSALWDGDDHTPPMVQATLGPDAGVIGAAASILTRQHAVIDRGSAHKT